MSSARLHPQVIALIALVGCELATARVSQITSEDLIGQLLDQTGGTADGLLLRKVRRSLQAALQEISAHKSPWSYERRTIVINTNTIYSTGSITYTNSTRTAVIATGTWPSWAGQGWLQIANKSYRIETRVSGTDVILAELENPGADLAAGTTYQLYQPSYRLPYDCRSIYRCWNTSSRYRLCGLTVNEFYDEQRAQFQSGTPIEYTITRDDWLKGAMRVVLYPYASGGLQFALLYDRIQLPLRIWKYNTGTVTASASSATVTGTSTAFTSAMVGSVIRFGTTTTEPTSLEGTAPYLEERVILAVNSATSLTLDEPLDNAYTAAKYVISDLVDVEPSAMKTAVMNCAALHFARERNADDAEMSRRDKARLESLRLAMQADRRFDIEDRGVGLNTGGFPVAHTPTNAGYG